VPANDDLYNDIQDIYEKHYYTYYIESSRPVRKSKEEFLKPDEIYASFRFKNMEQYGFKDIAMKFYDDVKTFATDEYINWLETMSEHRALPEKNRTALFSGIREAVNKHGGRRKIDVIYQLYMGRKM
jgi:hypothetical protein